MPSLPSLQELLAQVRESGELRLPLPGQGATPLRHAALKRWGAKDLSLARIAEAHTDALAILAEAGQAARAGMLYGVWASDGPASRLTYTPLAHGDWRLQGTKQFCSGATFLEAALVTAHGEAGVLLLDVALDDAGIRRQPSAWESAAMADTDTVAVDFNDVRVPRHRCRRGAGLVFGSPGILAWGDRARGLLGGRRAVADRGSHEACSQGSSFARSGRSFAISGLGIDCLISTGRARRLMQILWIKTGEARVRALKVRHLIERACTEALDRFGRATGPQLLAHDARVARQHVALTLYIRQCHAERDL